MAIAEKKNGTPPAAPITLRDVNARALRLFYNRLESSFSHMENATEWGKVTLEAVFEEGRAVNKIDVTLSIRDKL